VFPKALPQRYYPLDTADVKSPSPMYEYSGNQILVPSS